MNPDSELSLELQENTRIALRAFVRFNLANKVAPVRGHTTPDIQFAASCVTALREFLDGGSKEGEKAALNARAALEAAVDVAVAKKGMTVNDVVTIAHDHINILRALPVDWFSRDLPEMKTPRVSSNGSPTKAPGLAP